MKYNKKLSKRPRSFIFIVFSALVLATPHFALAASSINVWWPTTNATLSGIQPFKAVVSNRDISSYTMYWQVDGGTPNVMPTNLTDFPHKEATVDVTGWHWQPSGKYTLTFSAKDLKGNTIASNTMSVTVNAITVSPVTSFPTQFYVDPNSSAVQQVNAWISSRPSDASAIQILAQAPTAEWFGGWNTDVQNAVSLRVTAAQATGKTPIIVAYNIPQRDCGGYSAGGATDYIHWITSFANGIGDSPAVVVLEPDSIAQSGCLSGVDQAARFSLLSNAVSILKSHPHTRVYLDGGHAGWVDASTMAQRLIQSNSAAADGFSLNVSNFDSSVNESTYGQSISSLLGDKHFIIDTSRNGNGSNGEWCNPLGRAIGTIPTNQTGMSILDAYLWIKTPGESDGYCNGGPAAGTWWADYALSLVKNAP